MRDFLLSPNKACKNYYTHSYDKAEEPEMQVNLRQLNLGHVPADGGPNQIGNVEDEEERGL